MKILHWRWLAVGILSLSLFGCSTYYFPVQQGDVITHQTIRQLKPGMTKAQVLYILGAANVTNPFSNDTWYYFYTNKLYNLPRAEKQLVLQFKNDKLTNISGDYAPPAQLQYTTYRSK